MSSAMRVLTVVLGINIAGCATSFSPERVRGEIAAQTGQDPRYIFEIQLGRVTMHMIRTGLAGQVVDQPAPIRREFRPTTTLLLHVLRLLPFLCGGHHQLALENFALRQQLASG
jgi:hypothetical protein